MNTVGHGSALNYHLNDILEFILTLILIHMNYFNS